MSDKLRIRFILNPFSGISRKSKFPQLIKDGLDAARFDYDLCFTEAPGHAGELAEEASQLGFDAVVAVGGDGSINEVGSSLIGSEVALGIIPGGSGNGIARSLGISLQAQKAIEQINSFERTLIDTGYLDNRPFIGVGGIGFDAHIGERFLHRKTRGKLAYGYVMMTEFTKFSYFTYSVNEETESKQAFVLAFANTSQYGNNAVIAPLAEFQDEKLEFVKISEMKALRIPEMMLRLFSRTIDKADTVESESFESLKIKHSANFGHVDGEAFNIGPEIEVRINPKSLWVIR